MSEPDFDEALIEQVMLFSRFKQGNPTLSKVKLNLPLAGIRTRYYHDEFFKTLTF